MKFTAKTTDALQLPPGKKDFIAFDDQLAGFGLRLREGGARGWVFQYAVGGRQRRMVIGRAPALPLERARAIAAELHAKVLLGGDPAGEKAESRAKAGEMFVACLERYLARRRADPKLRASSYRHIERHLLRNLKALHPLHIGKVDRRAIAIELGKLADTAPVQANRTRSSLVTFLNWCAGEGLIDANPATLTNKNSEAARERVLSIAELVTIWHALPSGDFGDILKLLMLTGQRAQEMGGLRWDEIDIAHAIITLPPARTKNRRQHTVPLSNAARAVVEARAHTRELVFGREDSGLPNEILDRVHAAVTIPTTEHASLNLAQAVLIACYELHLASGDATRELPGPRKEAPPATAEPSVAASKTQVRPAKPPRNYSPADP